MSDRLLKEFRLIAPYGIPAILCAPAALVVSLPSNLHVQFFLHSFTFGLQILTFHLMGAVLFGGEFTEKTMERLLSNPVPRARIWREKLGLMTALLCIGLIVNLAVYVHLYEACWEAATKNIHTYLSASRPDALSKGSLHFWEFLATSIYSRPLNALNPLDFKYDESIYADTVGPAATLTFFILFGALGALLALCNGPLMTLYLRQTHVALGASLVWPVGLAGIADSLIHMFLNRFFPRALPAFYDRFDSFAEPILITALLALWCLAAYWLARRKFAGLEV